MKDCIPRLLFNGDIVQFDAGKAELMIDLKKCRSSENVTDSAASNLSFRTLILALKY